MTQQRRRGAKGRASDVADVIAAGKEKGYVRED